MTGTQNMSTYSWTAGAHQYNLISGPLNSSEYVYLKFICASVFGWKQEIWKINPSKSINICDKKEQ